MKDGNGRGRISFSAEMQEYVTFGCKRITKKNLSALFMIKLVI